MYALIYSACFCLSEFEYMSHRQTGVQTDIMQTWCRWYCL